MKQLFLLLSMLTTGIAGVSAQNYWNTVHKAPANGTTVVLTGDPNQMLTFSWESAVPAGTPPASYQSNIRFVEKDSDWALSFNVLAEDNGHDSSVFFYYEDLAGIFDQIKHGETRTFHWIISTLYYDTSGPNPPGPMWRFLTSEDTFDIHITRGTLDNEFNQFSLLAPADNYTYDVEGDPSNTLAFSWNSTTCPGGCDAPDYLLLIDTPGGNWDYPLHMVTSAGLNTSVNLTNTELASICVKAGIARGSSGNLRWTVMADNGSIYSFASPERRLTLNRKYLSNENTPFFCQLPANNTTLTLQGDTNSTYKFTWDATTMGSATAQYTLRIAEKMGSLNSPDITKDVSTQTEWNTTFGELYRLFNATYGNGWATLELKWDVQAELGGPTFYSDNTHNIKMIKGFFYANGIQEEKPEAAIIYPNPASDVLNIKNVPAGSFIRLSDLSGRVLIECTMPEGGLSLKVDSLPSGIYMLEQVTGTRQSVSKVMLNKGF